MIFSYDFVFVKLKYSGMVIAQCFHHGFILLFGYIWASQANLYRVCAVSKTTKYIFKLESKIKTLTTSIALCAVLTAGGMASAHASLINGSFETGAYTGWTLSENSGSPDWGTWGIASSGQTINAYDSTYDFYNGTNVTQFSPGLPRTYTATDGNYLAYQLQNGPETHRMYQDVSLSSTATTLSWDMFYQNHNISFDGSQYLAVSIRDLSDNVLSTLFMTNSGDPSAISMSSFSSDISAFAGSTVRLDVTMNVQQYYFDAGFDNFRVAAVPVPAAAWLLGSGLLGLIGVARRKAA